jgi:release factor glutamine methyltransferase
MPAQTANVLSTSMAELSDVQSTALIEVGRELQQRDYNFVTITPASHERVLARTQRPASCLRDVFGWNLPFEPSLLSRSMLGSLERAGAVTTHEGLLRATVRFSTLGQRLFAHSGFPTQDEQAVFFGPDTYRFAAFIRRAASSARRIVDVGCGSGAGGISVSTSETQQLVLSDINPIALGFARVNATLSGVQAELVQSDVLNNVTGELDLIVANPPYMRDPSGRMYRHGGGTYGEALSVRIVREALPRLARAGTLLLYTGAPVVGGVDKFRESIAPLLAEHTRIAHVGYEELDVDVFGEELSTTPYAEVERIAAVGLTVRLGAG